MTTPLATSFPLAHEPVARRSVRSRSSNASNNALQDSALRLTNAATLFQYLDMYQRALELKLRVLHQEKERSVQLTLKSASNFKMGRFRSLCGPKPRYQATVLLSISGMDLEICSVASKGRNPIWNKEVCFSLLESIFEIPDAWLVIQIHEIYGDVLVETYLSLARLAAEPEQGRMKDYSLFRLPGEPHGTVRMAIEVAHQDTVPTPSPSQDQSKLRPTAPLPPAPAILNDDPPRCAPALPTPSPSQDRDQSHTTVNPVFSLPPAQTTLSDGPPLCAPPIRSPSLSQDNDELESPVGEQTSVGSLWPAPAAPYDSPSHDPDDLGSLVGKQTPISPVAYLLPATATPNENPPLPAAAVRTPAQAEDRGDQGSPQDPDDLGSRVGKQITINYEDPPAPPTHYEDPPLTTPADQTTALAEDHGEVGPPQQPPSHLGSQVKSGVVLITSKIAQTAQNTLMEFICEVVLKAVIQLATRAGPVLWVRHLFRWRRGLHVHQQTCMGREPVSYPMLPSGTRSVL
ncbi:hypothetical protein KP509_18G051000 [Ceratopteris richardii]|uniref:C2 domain-containing protein n=1 Tax=Ceratopteris richardii TaxID=49495 RepID=A0A8T2STB4_CERRI|nr:hypothetical protein KP509_18G051000 [Ceratopteris richardii]